MHSHGVAFVCPASRRRPRQLTHSLSDAAHFLHRPWSNPFFAVVIGRLHIRPFVRPALHTLHTRHHGSVPLCGRSHRVRSEVPPASPAMGDLDDGCLVGAAATSLPTSAARPVEARHLHLPASPFHSRIFVLSAAATTPRVAASVAFVRRASAITCGPVPCNTT